mmetsp:Transcript_29679/g.88042  ORF Transcript_29679/g.88042 Transcript_29679/m.88042 type:complete len:295 (+) Transcript_29679:412-1296(+)
MPTPSPTPRRRRKRRHVHAAQFRPPRGDRVLRDGFRPRPRRRGSLRPAGRGPAPGRVRRGRDGRDTPVGDDARRGNGGPRRDGGGSLPLRVRRNPPAPVQPGGRDLPPGGSGGGSPPSPRTGGHRPRPESRGAPGRLPLGGRETPRLRGVVRIRDEGRGPPVEDSPPPARRGDRVRSGTAQPRSMFGVPHGRGESGVRRARRAGILRCRGTGRRGRGDPGGRERLGSRDAGWDIDSGVVLAQSAQSSGRRREPSQRRGGGGVFPEGTCGGGRGGRREGSVGWGRARRGRWRGDG